MKSNGVKKNYTKLEVLTSLIPKRVQDEVKPLLCMEEDEFPNKDAYYQVKCEIKRIFGPSEASQYQRAMSRVLSGKPSQLARALINDMCDHKLNGCCCHKWIFGRWHECLPTAVKQAVAHTTFNKDTLEDVLTLADKVYDSTRPHQSVAAIKAPAAVAAVSTNPSPHDTAFREAEPTHNWPTEEQLANMPPEVAAVYRVVRSKVGGGRGGRGGRGFRGGRGQGRGQGRGGAQTERYSKDNPRWKGPRHPDLPPFHSCRKHWDWGKSAHWCGEPNTCPWKNYTTPKNQN